MRVDFPSSFFLSNFQSYYLRNTNTMKRLFFFATAVTLLFSCTPEQAEEVKTQNEPTKSETQKEIVPTLVIHGGAGTIRKENMSPELEKEYTDKLEEALKTGYLILEKGGSSSDAVIAAIQIMEASPLFNAGIGAVYTHDETIEHDASFMDGKTKNAGAVSGVSRIKSPIEAAFEVMNSSVHVMMSGKGAEMFAKQQGLEIVDPSYFFNEKRHQQILQIKKSEEAELEHDGKSAQMEPYEHDYKFGTVGSVALDKNGNLAAGTSTGGMTNKRFGRIGDSPIIGAGTYADNQSCAVSSTGHGEYFIRNVVAYDIAARMKYKGSSLEDAANSTIEELGQIQGTGGVICLDSQGNIALPFNTAGMYRGWIKQTGQPNVLMYKN
jgi:beta-aspartyl-peptidase (threonine type)